MGQQLSLRAESLAELGWGRGVGAGGWRCCCLLMTQVALQPSSWESSLSGGWCWRKQEVSKVKSSEANELFFKSGGWDPGQQPTLPRQVSPGRSGLFLGSIRKQG